MQKEISRIKEYEQSITIDLMFTLFQRKIQMRRNRMSFSTFSRDSSENI